MKIASFNIKHRIFRNNQVISKNVLDVINNNKIDILCTQEIPRGLARAFKKYMPGFTINGDSRYHHYLKSLPFNEKNPIITKNEVIETKTVRYKNRIKNIKEFFKYLKHIPIIPRIATIVIVKIKDDKDICVINTHLDYKLSIIQKKQLDHLLKIIEEYKNKYDIVITGDFNMDISDKHFSLFIESLKETNIDMVKTKGYTWRNKKGKEKILDYIFISSHLEVNRFGIIKSNDLSDHEIIYVDISI